MNTLIILLNQPIAENVKTRLAKDIGVQKALDFYNKSMATIIQEHSDAPYDVLFAVDSSEYDWSKIVDEQNCILQEGNTLEEKLDRIFSQINTPTIVLSCDFPTVTQEDIIQAFELMKKNDCVLGPTKENEIYLIGFKKYYSVFNKKQKNTQKLFEQLMEELLLQKTKICLLETKENIDTGEEYNSFKEEFPNF